MTFKSGRVGSKKGSGTGRTRENMDFPKTIRFTLANRDFMAEWSAKTRKSQSRLVNEMVDEKRERGK